MNLVQSFLKPEYWYQPSQIWRRIRRTGPLPDTACVQVPWGLPMHINPQEAVGHSLWHLGVLDLAACEVCWRLLDPGESAVDVGTNIGAFTSLLARKSGPSGQVWSLEPHPRIHASFLQNLQAWRDSKVPIATIHPVTVAASDAAGTADFFEPAHFSSNAGTATLVAQSDGRRLTVQTGRLDDLLPAQQRFGVVKIDTEGHEPAVLRGATRCLTSGAFRDIVFEEHDTPPTDTTRILTEAGYTLFFIGRTFGGPCLTPPSDRATLPSWLPPNYLATRDPVRARARCKTPGWQVLQSR